MLDAARKLLQRNVTGTSPKAQSNGTAAPTLQAWDATIEKLAGLSVRTVSSDDSAATAESQPEPQVAKQHVKSDHINGNVTSIAEVSKQPAEYPARADLRKDIYRPLPVVYMPEDLPAPDSATACTEVLESLFKALEAGEVSKVKELFYEEQCYWRDQLALTYHFRTIKDREAVSSALVERAALAKVGNVAVIPNTARLTHAGPTLSWIDCFFSFKTSSPGTSCGGMLQLLPPPNKEGRWTIWTFATWLNDFDGMEEKEELLRQPSIKSDMAEHATTNLDVLIIGAGNAGLCLASRLKAYGVNYLAVDRNANIGDNWALRYDNMRFHVQKTFAVMPYLPWPEDMSAYPARDDLASQCKLMAESFDLNIWLETTVKSTVQDKTTQEWTVVLNTPKGHRTIQAKHLVQATGIGSRVPYIPDLKNKADEFQGVSMHSEAFKNGALLKKQGINSVIVVGSANTAFDIIDDCEAAGLEVTMIQRSPTFVLPTDYAFNALSMGIYNIVPTQVADCIVNAGPIAVGGQLVQGVHQMLAASEPHRYDKLRQAGFQIDASGDLMNNLLERCGGHYMDMGQTALIADGRVGVKSGVSPASYTSTGLKFSDGSSLSADCIIWCTGYADKNVREVTSSILGEGGPDIASKMDATWQLDFEGEVRGLWKRQLNIDNFWLFGGFTSQHRYYSRFLAIQIKAALVGKLPPAYRDIPEIA